MIWTIDFSEAGFDKGDGRAIAFFVGTVCGRVDVDFPFPFPFPFSFFGVVLVLVWVFFPLFLFFFAPRPGVGSVAQGAWAGFSAPRRSSMSRRS